MTNAVNQTRLYRFNLTAGQQLSVLVEPRSGDPDRYIWAFDHATRPPWVSNASSGNEQLSFVAPVSGLYQVEVFGYTAAEYSLDADIVTAGAVAATASAPLAPDKDVPGQPMIPVTSVPEQRYSIAPAPTQSFIYLPSVAR